MYFYKCGECKSNSKPIKEAADYLRLPVGHIWACSKCATKEVEKVQKLLNGYVVYRLQF